MNFIAESTSEKDSYALLRALTPIPSLSRSRVFHTPLEPSRVSYCQESRRGFTDESYDGAVDLLRQETSWSPGACALTLLEYKYSITKMLNESQTIETAMELFMYRSYQSVQVQ